jgi:hypothetical protein
MSGQFSATPVAQGMPDAIDAQILNPPMEISVRLIYVSTIALFLLVSSATHAADAQSVTGVVTNVNPSKQTLTVRNDANAERRTYFLSDDAQIMSRGQPIPLSRVRKGNTVTLTYRTTDRGREVVSLRAPNPAEIVEIIPVAVTEERSITGIVTGVRPSVRTITIREDSTRTRLTLKVPEETRIQREGRDIRLRMIEKGDQIMARYRVTDEGLILVTGRSPEPVAEPAPAVEPALPKTAGNLFMYLFVGLGLLGAAGLSRVVRSRVTK